MTNVVAGGRGEARGNCTPSCPIRTIMSVCLVSIVRVGDVLMVSGKGNNGGVTKQGTASKRRAHAR